MPMAERSPRPRATAALIWILGGWLFLSIAMAYVAGANFARLHPAALRDADAVYAAIPAGEPRRVALRYAASEMNRHLFALYNTVQLGLAAAALLALWRSRRGGRLGWTVLALCFLACLAFHFFFTPEMIERGRLIDFMPRDPEPEEVRSFHRLHRLNVVLEVAKMAGILGLSLAVILRSGARLTATRGNE
jgi:hypothetical protein